MKNQLTKPEGAVDAEAPVKAEKPQFFLVQPEAMQQIINLIQGFPLTYPQSTVRDNVMQYLGQLKTVGVTENEVPGKT